MFAGLQERVRDAHTQYRTGKDHTEANTDPNYRQKDHGGITSTHVGGVDQVGDFDAGFSLSYDFGLALHKHRKHPFSIKLMKNIVKRLYIEGGKSVDSPLVGGFTLGIWESSLKSKNFSLF
jgi:hypothetical protein